MIALLLIVLLIVILATLFVDAVSWAFSGPVAAIIVILFLVLLLT